MLKKNIEYQNFVKMFREVEGLSQEQLGNLVKASKQTIDSIEKGKYDPSITLSLEIAKVLHTNIAALFSFRLGNKSNYVDIKASRGGKN